MCEYIEEGLEARVGYKAYFIGHSVCYSRCKFIKLISSCLLIDPNPESALNEEAGKLLLEKYEEFARHAKLWTEIYAMVENKTSNGENMRSLNDCQNTLEANNRKRRSLKRL